MQDNEQNAAIRKLNDDLRRTLTGGRILLTPGVLTKEELAVTRLMVKLTQYINFTTDNDPYGEHDFGEIIDEGSKYFWKIDYYDKTMQMHSPDAADPAVTCRVLTVMLAEEY